MDKFTHLVPGPEAKCRIDEFRVQFNTLFEMTSQLPPSRELALAVTNLEQAAMWANKAAVLSDPESKPE